MSKDLWLVFAVSLLATPGFAQTKLERATSKAYDQLAKGKPVEAVKTLTKAAATSGAEGYVALGRLHERVGNLDKAGAAYKKAAEVATPAYKPDALAQLSTFTLRTGTGMQALRIANIAISLRASATTWAARARAQVRREFGPLALNSADKAVALDASNAMAYLARGEARGCPVAC